MKKILIVAFLIVLTGCNVSPIAPDPGNIEIPELNQLSEINESELDFFYDELKEVEISLTLEETKEIGKIKKAEPIGRWAKVTAGTPKDNLSKNYSLLGNSILGLKNNEISYMKKAVEFARSKNESSDYYFDVNYFRTWNKIIIVKWDSITNEFVIPYEDGRISNYQVTTNIRRPRYIPIPKSL